MMVCLYAYIETGHFQGNSEVLGGTYMPSTRKLTVAQRFKRPRLASVGLCLFDMSRNGQRF